MELRNKRFIDTFKFFNIFYKKRFLGGFYHIYGRRILLNKLFIQIVRVVSTLLFGFNQARFQQNLNMMTYRRLCQVNYTLDFGALAGPTSFGDVM